MRKSSRPKDAAQSPPLSRLRCRRFRGSIDEYRPFSSSELVEHGADTGFLAAVRRPDLGFGGSDLRRLGPADLVLRADALVDGSSPGGMADRVADVPSARVDPRPSDAKPAHQRGPGLSAAWAVAALRLLSGKPLGAPCGRRPDRPAPRPGILLRHRGGLEPDGAGAPDAGPRQQYLRWPGADRACPLDRRLYRGRSPLAGRWRPWPLADLGNAWRGCRGGAGLDLGHLRNSTLGLCGAVRLSGPRSGADPLLRRTPGGTGGRAPDGDRRERLRAGPAVPPQ